jgi:filamentous hemagglutinin
LFQRAIAPNSNSGWLLHWEGRGIGNSRGHVISEHVGKADTDLVARLASNNRISAASTSTDQATAEAVIGGAIRQNRTDLAAWLRSAQPGDQLRLPFTGTDVIGREIRRGQAVVGDRTNARIILQAVGDGKYHMLTVFPE